MLKESEIYEILVAELPGISADLEGPTHRGFYNEAKCLSSYTQKNIESGNIQIAQKCFLIADQIMKKGDYCIKSVLMISFMKDVYPLIKESKSAILKNMLPNSVDRHFQYTLQMEKW